MEVRVFADDTSGALDIAGSLHSRGYTAEVHLKHTSSVLPDSTTHVFDLDSRYDQPATASQKLSEALLATPRTSSTITFLKIDSTLRGNILPSIHALEEVTEKPIFIAPSLPLYGRTCIDGVYYVGECAITNTEFAKDISFQYQTPLLNGGSPDIKHINRKALDRGTNHIIDTILTSQENKFTFDTRTQEDLELIANTALLLNAALVGSSGLARALPSQYLGDKEMRRSINLALPPLFVVGSLHSLSRAQRDLLVQSGVFGIELETNAVGNETKLNTLRAKAQNHIEQGNAVCIFTADEATGNIPRQEMARSVAFCAQNDTPHNLVISGGETREPF